MPTPDLQHQRLRHLFASAILELWKKETGSVTSVLIEGTVCVTVHGGRTTVVQLCERFAGLVNGDCDRPLDVGMGAAVRHGDAGHLTPRTSAAKSRGRTATATITQSKDSNNNVRRAPRDVHDEIGDATDEDETSFGGDDDVDDDHSSMLIDDDTVGACDAVQGHTRSTSGSFSPDNDDDDAGKLHVDDSADDSAIHDMSMNRTGNSLADVSAVLAGSPDRGTSKTPASNSGNDLLLSSPHDYTAQVRNVIRQRLLNASGKQPSSSFRGQTTGITRPHSSPYYRSAADATPPSLWIKHETPSAAASEAMATAARRLATQYAAAAAGHIPMTLMSPPPPLAMSVGLPLPGVPLNASLHNLLGMKSSASPAGAPVLMPGTPTSHVPPCALDSKRSNVVEPAVTGGDAGQAEQKVYRCDYCQKTFLFKSKYHEHLPVHTSARPFQCHLCTRTYKYKYDLRVHLRTHLGIPTKSTVCPFCAARFATNKFLRQHMRDAHADQNQNVVANLPSTSVESVAGGGGNAEMPPTSENVDEEQCGEDVTVTGLVADDSHNDDDAAGAAPSLTVAETVNSAGQNDDSKI